MAEIVVKIPEELEMGIKEHKLDVSKVVAESIADELSRFVALKTIASRSKLTEKDAIELGRRLKEGRFEELRKKGLL
jgi:post-segregation antitoxin (ccd killing protein)